VRLRSAAGEIVEAEASRGRSYLASLLETTGARVLGEVGIGLNYDIDRFTGHSLFDEKIGGTVHFAIGNSYRTAGGLNDSAIHIDMVCDLREQGEIHADGQPIWRDGRFLAA
jgi:aminopeptidase